mgnify:CR=1 FL=1
MSTYHPKSGDITRKWYVIDATDVVLGRLAVTAADLLRGKKKPYFAPNVDCGDNVIIINADKVHISSNKREREMRYRHSGYPGGLTATSYAGISVLTGAGAPLWLAKVLVDSTLFVVNYLAQSRLVYRVPAQQPVPAPALATAA